MHSHWLPSMDSIISWRLRLRCNGLCPDLQPRLHLIIELLRGLIQDQLQLHLGATVVANDLDEAPGAIALTQGAHPLHIQPPFVTPCSPSSPKA